MEWSVLRRPPLPFGLRSASFIFNSVADMVEWILLHKHRLSDLLPLLAIQTMLLRELVMESLSPSVY